MVCIVFPESALSIGIKCGMLVPLQSCFESIPKEGPSFDIHALSLTHTSKEQETPTLGIVWRLSHSSSRLADKYSQGAEQVRNDRG